MRPMVIPGMQLSYQKTPCAGTVSITGTGDKLGFRSQSMNLNGAAKGATMSREPRFGQYKNW